MKICIKLEKSATEKCFGRPMILNDTYVLKRVEHRWRTTAHQHDLRKCRKNSTTCSCWSSVYGFIIGRFPEFNTKFHVCSIFESQRNINITLSRNKCSSVQNWMPLDSNSIAAWHWKTSIPSGTWLYVVLSPNCGYSPISFWLPYICISLCDGHW